MLTYTWQVESFLELLRPLANSSLVFAVPIDAPSAPSAIIALKN
jgi:hypothetical protein